MIQLHTTGNICCQDAPSTLILPAMLDTGPLTAPDEWPNLSFDRMLLTGVCVTVK